MGLLDKLSDLKQMRDQAKQMEGLLAQEQISGASSGSKVQIVMDGNQNVQSVVISDDLIPDRLARVAVAAGVKDAMGDLFKQYKKMLQKKFGNMLG